MKNQIIKLFLLILVASFLVLSCIKGTEQNTETKVVEKPAVSQAKAPEKLSPQGLGDKIADLYETTMFDLTELLKDKPEVSEIRDKVQTLKEDCVQKMVQFGKLRESLDAAGKSMVDSRIRMKLNSLYNDPVWTAYNDIQQHYFSDREFHKIIMSFNIITQYANFDLLKKQEPEEAKRLGIE